jgi:glycosyltransferase involved in cell wall biosynthesis
VGEIIMDLQRYPRVLIVTVNPLSTTSNNGKTYASFFKGYPKEKIAQLYFHREIPTSDVCENYYRISDEDIINNILGRNKNIGKKVCRETIEERLISENINNVLKKSSIIRFIRSLFWLSLDLEKDGVKRWLDKFEPEVIFFCGGNANYLYSKVLKLAKKYNAKIVYYITDDYVLPYFSFNIFNFINRNWTRSVFKKICKNSSLILTIGDKMSNVYKKRYGIESKKIMNLVEIRDEKISSNQLKNNDLEFVYVGGLHSNRWKVLSLIGKSLERVDKKGFRGSIKIYSQKQPEEKILKKLNNKNYSKYCGSLNSEGVKRVLNHADVLVHVESFDRSSKKITYLSISTKIPEYMSSGKCILAVGPKDVASIEYIMETKSGFVITSVDNENMDNKIMDIFQNPDKRNYYIAEALLTVKKNHDTEIEKEEFQKYIIKMKSKN